MKNLDCALVFVALTAGVVTLVIYEHLWFAFLFVILILLLKCESEEEK